MNRRELLRRTIVAGITSSGAVASAAFVKAKPALSNTRDRLNDSVDVLEKRVKKLERNHKNLIRTGAIALAVSTGIDLTLLF
jgi:hypothetical protein